MSEHLRRSVGGHFSTVRDELASRPHGSVQVPWGTSLPCSSGVRRPKIYVVLQTPNVVNAIHASNVPGKWVECKNRVHTEFYTRKSNSSITVLPRVLEKIPVMLFVGDQDLICNYVGIESMIQAMTWNGETGLGVRLTSVLSFMSDPASCSCRRCKHSPGPSGASRREPGSRLVTLLTLR